jgi:hypothetical protein
MKIKVIDRWQEVIQNVTQVIVLNDDDDEIDNTTILTQFVETIDEGDKYSYTIEECLQRFPGLRLEIETSVKMFNEKYKL